MHSGDTMENFTHISTRQNHGIVPEPLASRMEAALKFHLLTARSGLEEEDEEYSNWFARRMLFCLNKKPLNAQTQNIVKQLKGSTKVL